MKFSVTLDVRENRNAWCVMVHPETLKEDAGRGTPTGFTIAGYIVAERRDGHGCYAVFDLQNNWRGSISILVHADHMHPGDPFLAAVEFLLECHANAVVS